MVDLENLEEALEEMKAGRANYLLINVVAKRVRSYNEGEKPLVEMEPGADASHLAVEELRRGKLILVSRKSKAEETAPASSAPDEEE